MVLLPPLPPQSPLSTKTPHVIRDRGSHHGWNLRARHEFILRLPSLWPASVRYHRGPARLLVLKLTLIHNTGFTTLCWTRLVDCGTKLGPIGGWSWWNGMTLHSHVKTFCWGHRMVHSFQTYKSYVIMKELYPGIRFPAQ